MRTLFDFNRWQMLSMQPSIRSDAENDILNMFPFYLIQNCTRVQPSRRLTIKEARSLIEYEISKDFKNEGRYESYTDSFNEIIKLLRESGKWVIPPMNTSKFDGKVTSIPETICISTEKFDKPLKVFNSTIQERN